MNIYGDKWSGLHCEEWEVCASPEELVARLVRLDAQVHTLLSLASGPPDEAHLGVGGGAGQYLVYQQVSDLELWNIVRPDAEKAWVSSNTGGQEGDHPARQVVDLAGSLPLVSGARHAKPVAVLGEAGQVTRTMKSLPNILAASSATESNKPRVASRPAG